MIHVDLFNFSQILSKTIPYSFTQVPCLLHHNKQYSIRNLPDGTLTCLGSLAATSFGLHKYRLLRTAALLPPLHFLPMEIGLHLAQAMVPFGSAMQRRVQSICQRHVKTSISPTMQNSVPLEHRKQSVQPQALLLCGMMVAALPLAPMMTPFAVMIPHMVRFYHWLGEISLHP